jgi:hypothetical protein
VEYDPLIPPEMRLLLTTNSCTTEKSSKLELGMNEAANERYFDRPEVVKAYREQELIQTPDFEEITQTPTAMSRLRPRNSEEVRGFSTQSTLPPSYYFFDRRQPTSQMRHMKKGIVNTKHSRSVYVYGRKKSSNTSSTSLKSGSINSVRWTGQHFFPFLLPPSHLSQVNMMVIQMTVAQLFLEHALMALLLTMKGRGDGRKCLMWPLLSKNAIGYFCLLISSERPQAQATSTRLWSQKELPTRNSMGNL